VKVILLGPQRRPTLEPVVRSLHLDGPVATITAGWQEREPDDGELSGLLGGRDVNLGLYRRWLEVAELDPDYAAAERRLADELAERQDLYLLRLDHALRAVYALQRRSGSGRSGSGGRLRAQAVDEAVAAVRELAGLRPHDRPEIARQRARVEEILGQAAALVIAGGHVGVLAEVLHLFNVAPTLGTPVIAWSAGAMALTDRIVLFGDRSPQGPGHPEVYGAGLSVLRDVVLLPHARSRLLLEEVPRMAVFARRFAPGRCVLLDSGARIELDTGGAGRGTGPGWPAGTRVLAADGHATALEAA
jgi:hypothetical protein